MRAKTDGRFQSNVNNSNRHQLVAKNIFILWKSAFGRHILTMEFESNSLWGSLSRISWYFLCDSLLVGSAVVGVFALSRAFDAVRRKCGLSSKN